MTLALTALAPITAVAIGLDGLPPGQAALCGGLVVSTGTLLLRWHFWLVVRYGTGPTHAVGAVGPAVPWSWAIAGQPAATEP